MKTPLLIFASLVSKNTVHVILAEDDGDDRGIFLEAMNEVVPHAIIEIAENGEQLMQKLLKEDALLPDIVFLDLNMPGKNGHKCLKEIRDSEKLKSMPVIIYSTTEAPEDIDKTFEEGASLYLPKPHSFSDLKAMLTKIFAIEWNEFIKPEKDNFIAGK